MLTIDSDVLYDGKVYRAAIAQGDSDEAWIRFLQPKDETLKSQRFHDNALNYLLEQEEDIKVRKTALEPENPEYVD